MKNARIPNPPRSARITKALLKETLEVLRMVDCGILTPRWLETPMHSGNREWLCELKDRLCACMAHLHRWKDSEKTRRRAMRRKGAAK